MTEHNASVAQYGPTPTPTCVACLTPPPAHRHPETGYDVAPVLAAGVFLIALGTFARSKL